MNLEEQYNCIDALKTDKHMSLLLLGIKGNMALDKVSEDLTLHFKPTPEDNIHETEDEGYVAVRDYQRQLVEAYDVATIDFYQEACMAIGDFIGIHDDDFFFDVFSDYGAGKKTLDDVVACFKALAKDINEIPEGHVLLVENDQKMHMPKDEFERNFPILE